jgi:hypothetical protein
MVGNPHCYHKYITLTPAVQSIQASSDSMPPKSARSKATPRTGGPSAHPPRQQEAPPTRMDEDAVYGFLANIPSPLMLPM